MTGMERARTTAGELRVLILMPVGRDARLAADALARVPLTCHVCGDLEDLRREIAAGAGVVLLADEALAGGPAADPERWIGAEPPWSHVPVVVLTRRRPPARLQIDVLRRLELRQGTSFLQRPVPRLTLVSAVRSALEGRLRQYVVRQLLDDLRAAVLQRDRFLATLSHELRNPLGAIATAASLLRGEGQVPAATAAAAAGIIQRQSRNLARILDDLLELSRITHGKLELHRSTGDLRHSVRNALDAVRAQFEARDVAVEVDLPEEPVPVHVDPTRIEQVLWNLLGNAAKFVGRGGHVAVSLVVSEDTAEVRVRDDGRGMTPEFLAKAFEPFEQAESGGGGLGLGLSLARRLARLHGGSLTASSQGPGEGSEFVLRLPLEAVPAPAAAEARPAAATTSRRRVLIVEDHADAGEALRDLLGSLGHEARLVTTGGEALEAAAADPPEVVLLDMGLPDTHGTEVAAALRRRFGGAPLILAMTGFGQEADRRRSLAAGCDHHLTKPIEMRRLAEYLGKARPAR